MWGGRQEWFSFNSLFPGCLTTLGTPQLGSLGQPRALSYPGHSPRPILLACLGPKSDRGHRLAARAPLFHLPGERR